MALIYVEFDKCADGFYSEKSSKANWGSSSLAIQEAESLGWVFTSKDICSKEYGHAICPKCQK